MHFFAPRLGGLVSDGVRYPGISIADDRRRYQVSCGRAKRIELLAGDLVTLINDDGGSRIWICAFDERGDDATPALGQSNSPREDGLPTGIDRGEIDAWMMASGGSDKPVTRIPIFNETTPAGERFVARAESRMDFWVLVPLDQSTLEEGGGGSVTVEISPAARGERPLPDPVGAVREEFRVDSGTARAYHLRKGDYVQVIDVEGRQCSDFMAMRAGALDNGVERYIDSTVTRTLVAGAYPAPGLFDKFYDQDMVPLLALAQDTVGRHDTFALACTARGYEERGFPGHLNCSDNISQAYEPFGIARRAAWPAINFFFNSAISPADNRLQAGEAWSRPGDHVALQALTDLVCVSTACPDDVDPINGWNPTDIHVRIYKPERPLVHAVAHRPFAESEASMTVNSAFHARTSALTKSFAVARDVWLPSSYESTRTISEYWACRSAVTVQDMSSLRKYDVLGPDAETLLQACLSRNIAKLSANRAVYALMLSETGSVIDDGTLFRLNQEAFRWCCGSEESARQLKRVAEERGLRVWIKALWSAMPNLAVQGPNSRELMKRVAFIQPHQPSLDNVRWFGFTVARLGDRQGRSFMLSRTGYTGELGYEIFCSEADSLAVWDALMDAGGDLGLQPMGSDALEILRVEAGLMASGHEFLPGVDAHEAGLGFAVDMAKGDFVGRAALERNGGAPRRKLVGLQFRGNEVPEHGAPVFSDTLQVGEVTSAVRSPMFQSAIAMARLAVEFADADKDLEVGCLDGHIKRLPARVCDIPFYDPKRERARA